MMKKTFVLMFVLFFSIVVFSFSYGDCWLDYKRCLENCPKPQVNKNIITIDRDSTGQYIVKCVNCDEVAGYHVAIIYEGEIRNISFLYGKFTFQNNVKEHGILKVVGVETSSLKRGTFPLFRINGNIFSAKIGRWELSNSMGNLLISTCDDCERNLQVCLSQHGSIINESIVRIDSIRLIEEYGRWISSSIGEGRFTVFHKFLVKFTIKGNVGDCTLKVYGYNNYRTIPGLISNIMLNKSSDYVQVLVMYNDYSYYKFILECGNQKDEKVFKIPRKICKDEIDKGDNPYVKGITIFKLFKEHKFEDFCNSRGDRLVEYFCDSRGDVRFKSYFGRCKDGIIINQSLYKCKSDADCIKCGYTCLPKKYVIENHIHCIQVYVPGKCVCTSNGECKLVSYCKDLTIKYELCNNTVFKRKVPTCLCINGEYVCLSKEAISILCKYSSRQKLTKDEIKLLLSEIKEKILSKYEHPLFKNIYLSLLHLIGQSISCEEGNIRYIPCKNSKIFVPVCVCVKGKWVCVDDSSYNALCKIILGVKVPKDFVDKAMYDYEKVFSTNELRNKIKKFLEILKEHATIFQTLSCNKCEIKWTKVNGKNIPYCFCFNGKFKCIDRETLMSIVSKNITSRIVCNNIVRYINFLLMIRKDMMKCSRLAVKYIDEMLKSLYKIKKICGWKGEHIVVRNITCPDGRVLTVHCKITNGNLSCPSVDSVCGINETTCKQLGKVLERLKIMLRSKNISVGQKRELMRKFVRVKARFYECYNILFQEKSYREKLRKTIGEIRLYENPCKTLDEIKNISIKVSRELGGVPPFLIARFIEKEYNISIGKLIRDCFLKVKRKVKEHGEDLITYIRISGKKELIKNLTRKKLRIKLNLTKVKGRFIIKRGKLVDEESGVELNISNATLISKKYVVKVLKNKTIINYSNVIVSIPTDINISVSENEVLIEKGNETYVKLVVDHIVNKLKRNRVRVKAIKLEKKKNKYIYEVEGKKEGIFLFIIPVSYDVRYEIDAESGRILREKKPWYAFFIG